MYIKYSVECLASGKCSINDRFYQSRNHTLFSFEVLILSLDHRLVINHWYNGSIPEGTPTMGAFCKCAAGCTVLYCHSV